MALGRVGAILGSEVSRLARSCSDGYRLLEVAALATVRYFEQNHQLFPRRDGWGSMKAGVSWGPLSVSRAAAILHNPIYGGIYTYDRKNPRKEDPEDLGSGGRIWIEGSHPGYITVEQYKRNVAQLAGNRVFFLGMRRKGSAREGGGLLQGIVLCGLCGRHMDVVYQPGADPRYRCYTSATRQFCQHVNGRYVDRLVEEVVLEALSREELELALGVLEKIKERAQELENQWEKRIEAGRYEADKARRRYHLVEPENRLVARTLESEWNARLEEVERLEEEYQKVRERLPFTMSPDQREQILALAEDLPRVWKAPATKNSQRKQLLRLLIEDVTLRNRDDPWGVEVSIRWKTGVVSRHQARRVDPRPHRTAPEVVARIEQLCSEHIDREIANILNAEGYRTGYCKLFTEGRVTHIRHRRGLIKYHSPRTKKTVNQPQRNPNEKEKRRCPVQLPSK